MNRNATIIALAAATAAANASIVTLTPDVINGGDTNRTQFTDGDATFTPFIGANPATFNANGTRLGIDGQGTNDGAFNDPDTEPNNGNEEMLQLSFVATAGLTQITWDFSRAGGNNAPGGIEISGFNSDPGASFDGRNFAPNGSVPPLSSTFDPQTGTLFFELPFAIGFAGEIGILNLANAEASAGADLMLKVFDEGAGGAQLAVRSISYNNAVPTPGTLAAALTLGVGAMSRRRRTRP